MLQLWTRHHAINQSIILQSWPPRSCQAAGTARRVDCMQWPMEAVNPIPTFRVTKKLHRSSHDTTVHFDWPELLDDHINAACALDIGTSKGSNTYQYDSICMTMVLQQFAPKKCIGGP